VLVTETNHPPYRYLFKERKLSGQRSADALDLPQGEGPGEGMEVVPTADAEALVGYLLSLDRTAELPEAKAIPASDAAATPAPSAPAAQPAAQ
jgi:cytochrome c oxidase cbb3-type subunit 2